MINCQAEFPSVSRHTVCGRQQTIELIKFYYSRIAMHSLFIRGRYIAHLDFIFSCFHLSLAIFEISFVALCPSATMVRGVISSFVSIGDMSCHSLQYTYIASIVGLRFSRSIASGNFSSFVVLSLKGILRPFFYYFVRELSDQNSIILLKQKTWPVL